MSPYTFDQYTATRIYTGIIRYAPNGEQILHVNNVTGQFNLWTIPSGGGIPRQLTSYTDNTIRNAYWSPDGAQIALQADQNGDEQHQLYLLNGQGGWPEALTQKLDSQHNLGHWSPDGQKIAFSANDANPRDMDLVLLDIKSGERKRLTTGQITDAGFWSPDGRYLTAALVRSNTDLDILLYDTETGEMTNCTPHDGQIIFVPVNWAPDGSGFYILTNQGREFVGLGFYSIAEKSWKWVETPDYDIENIDISRNGKVMAWSVNENGASKLYGRNLEDNTAITMPDLPIGVLLNMRLNPTGTRLAVVYNRPVAASNLYEIDLESGEMLALGQSMLGGIDPDIMVEPEAIAFETFDGKQIPAWLYKPQNPVPGMQYPVVLSIHGGPESQERPTYSYNGLYQYLLSRGFGILAPNIRGSSGYGISYQKLIHRDFGGDDLKDIEHAAKYLRGLEWVDNNRIAVFGGSYGGFASLSAVTRLPDYWAVGVDIVGPANLVTFAKAVPEFWKPMMKAWVGDPEEDYDMLMERSPITYVDAIKAPLLVIQGANDPRVVKAESDQMVERIRQNGGDVQYYVDEEEGHGATRRANAIKWMRMVTEYLEERLLDEPVV